MRLLTAAGAGAGTPFEIKQTMNRELDQFRTVYVWGTFGGSTVTLEVSPDGVNWFDAGIALTAQGAQNVEFRALWARGRVTGGAGQAIDMWML